MLTKIALVTMVGLLAIGQQAAAEGFVPVKDRDRFVSLVEGRELTRFGIRLSVEPDGDITGRAFGREVTGDWAWQNGYFCRNLSFGADPLEYNCQLVEEREATLRFTSDQGAGIYADLTLR